MAVFTSTPLQRSPLHRRLQRNPAFFGIPFVIMMVGASYGLSYFTQTKYDYQDSKVSTLNKEQELGLSSKRKKFDIREEYFKITAAQDDNWEPKRIQRPEGLPEWGVPPPQSPDVLPGTKPSS